MIYIYILGGTTDLRYFTLLPANSKKRQTSNTFPYDGTLSSDATTTINSAVKIFLHIKTRKFIYILYRLRWALVFLQIQLNLMVMELYHQEEVNVNGEDCMYLKKLKEKCDKYFDLIFKVVLIDLNVLLELENVI